MKGGALRTLATQGADLARRPTDHNNYSTQMPPLVAKPKVPNTCPAEPKRKDINQHETATIQYTR